jgi:hypothetical protein
MLALQRSVGNRRVAELVTRADRRVLARAFGFELELGVPITARTTINRGSGDERVPVQPKTDTKARVAKATGGEFEVKVDHSKSPNTLFPVDPDLLRVHKSARQIPIVEQARQAQRPLTPKEIELAKKDGLTPIIELVTAPFDELTLTPDQVRGKMQTLVDFANEMKRKTEDFKKVSKLDSLAGITVTSANRNYVGAEWTGPAFQNPMLNPLGAFVQQTYGVSLNRIGDEFTYRATQKGSRLTATNVEALKQAVNDGKEMAEHLVERYRGRGFAPTDPRPLQGFLTLMSYYLRIGTVDRQKSDLIKKRLGIFYYKTQLSTLRKSLVESDPNFKWIFENRWSFIRDGLLLVTERKGNEPLLRGPDSDNTKGTGPKLNDFLESVLKGTSDPVWSESKNPYSAELVAETLGVGSAQGLGVVIENRRYAATIGSNELAKVMPEDWVSMGLELYYRLRALHGAPVAAPADVPVAAANAAPALPLLTGALVNASSSAAPPPPPPPPSPSRRAGVPVGAVAYSG